tara:strand:+ start:822 stop:1655 length:834 start_codon:yes stop_codon:yes gene_type:complete
MCLIVVGNKDNIVREKTILENALTINSNGFGLMYFKDDDVISKKTLSKEFKDIQNLIQSVYKDCVGKLALHFRFATEGIIDKVNTHPLTVLNKNEHGRSLMLMHNSPMLPTAMIDKDRSDTHQFVKYYLRPVLKSNPDLLYNQKWIEQLSRDVDSSRLVFADGKTNKFIYVNKNLWSKRNKVFYSNDNSFSLSRWGSSMYGHYDYEDQNDKLINGSYNTKQSEMYEELKTPDDFLQLPLDEDLLSKLDVNQIKEYVEVNNSEVVNFLEQLKYDYLGY